MSRSVLRTLAILTVLLQMSGTVRSQDAREAVPSAESAKPDDEICRVLRDAATQNGLPIDFFARIIWQESRFDPAAYSRAGAQGIAQFMPATAASRGLLNPFDPIAALRESASYLRELERTFGNLGLAAAAYNAGPGRLTRWIAGKTYLPAETLAYVQIVTGEPIASWSAGGREWKGTGNPGNVPCPIGESQFTNTALSQQSGPKLAEWLPWGVQLLGDWTEGQVLAKYERLRRAHADVLGDKDPLVLVTYGPSGMSKHFLVRVAAHSKIEAEQLCNSLQKETVSCFAVPNKTEEQLAAEAQRYARLMSHQQSLGGSPSSSKARRSALSK